MRRRVRPLLTVCLLLLLPPPPLLDFAKASLNDAQESCPAGCQCASHQAVVNCSQQALEELPALPTVTQVLNVTHNRLRTLCHFAEANLTRIRALFADFNSVGILRKECFANLTTLQHLSLSKNRLRKVFKEAFVDLSQLLRLNLSHNKLRRIDWFSFKGLRKLRWLNLERNGLSMINDGSFGSLDHLEELYLNNNRLVSVTRGWLYGLERLATLVLSGNLISRLDSEGWRFCRQLVTLDLANNALVALDYRLFGALEHLRNLNLSSNALGRIHEKAFGGLLELTTLDLSHNQLGSIFMSGQHIFQGLHSLQVLRLNGNGLRSLPANVFRGLSSLTHLEVLGNPIVIFAEDALPSVDSVGLLLIDSNKMLCNCRSKWLMERLQRDNMLGELGQPCCGYPASYAGRKLIDVAVDNLTCDDFWPRPVIVKQPEPIVAIQGDTVTFNCSSRCKGCNLMIYWSRNDMRLDARPEDGLLARVQQEDAEGHWLSSLTIEAVDETDSGVYHCHVINELTMAVSNKVLLTVHIPPYFIKKPTNVAVPVGDTVRLECAAGGTPMPSISWQKDGGVDFPAARERRVHIMSTDDVFVILPAKRQDSGLYSCIAESEAGVAKSDARVAILERKKTSSSMGDKTVQLGETAVLECKLGNDDVSVPVYPEWFHNGEPVKTGRPRITEDGRMLIILDARSSDQGIYACRHNGAFRTARLIVRGPQDANSKKLKPPRVKVDEDKDVSKGRPTLDLATTITPILAVIFLCVAATSSIWLCYILRCRQPPAVVVAFRQHPLEISAVAGL